MKIIPSFLIALSCVTFPLMNSSEAAIIADFSGGNSTTVVDAYAGKPGLGWSTAWTARRSSATVVQGSVTTPVWGDTRRLVVTPNASVTEGGVHRTFVGNDDLNYASDIDLSRKFTIAFSFSIQDLGTFLNTATNFLYLGQQSANSNNSTSASIWYLYGFGGTSKGDPVAGFTGAQQGYWNFFEGKRGASGSHYVSSGIEIKQDALYRFEIEVDPVADSSRISISVDGGTAVFHNQVFTNTTTFPTLLNFTQNVVAGQTAGFSLGDISITQIPEPSTAYLVLGATCLCWAGIKKMRGQAPKQ